MAQYDQRPNADNGSYKQWSTSSGTVHWSLIDENMGVKNTSDYVYGTAAGLVDQYGFSSGVPTEMTTITAINIDLYCKSVETTECGLAIALMDGATVIAETTWHVSTGGAWQVLRFAFTGLSLTQTQLSTLQVRLSTATPSGGEPHPVVL